MEVKRALIALLFLSALFLPASAIAIGDLQYRIIPLSLVYNSSVLYSDATNIGWDGSNGFPPSQSTNIIEEAYVTLPDTDTNVTINLSYMSGTVQGYILQTTSIPFISRTVTIGLGTDSTTFTRPNALRTYRISYARDNATGKDGIAISDAYGSDLVTYVAGTTQITAIKSVIKVSSVTADPILGMIVDGVNPDQIMATILSHTVNNAAFYEADDILSNPIYAIQISSSSGYIEGDWIYDTAQNFQAKVSTPSAIQTDIIKLITTFFTLFSQVTAEIFFFETILVANAPWLFLMIEVIGSMNVIWNANGSIWRVFTGLWKLQKKIVDFVMYIPTFIEKHWQFTVLVLVISVIGYISTLATNPAEAFHMFVQGLLKSII